MRKPIREILAENLTAWMSRSGSLGTEQALAMRAGVAQSSVHRAKTAATGTSIDNVDALAKAFGRRAHDLLYPYEADTQIDLEPPLSELAQAIAKAFDELKANDQKLIKDLIFLRLANAKPESYSHQALK